MLLSDMSVHLCRCECKGSGGHGWGGIHASTLLTTLHRTIYIMILYVSCISAGAPEEAVKLAQKTRGLYCYHPGCQIIV